MCEVIEDANELDRYIIAERIIAAAYIPSAVCLALGSLGRSGVVPYASAHEWNMLLAGSVYLTIANGRDVNHGIRCLFLSRAVPGFRRSRRGSGSWSSMGATIGGGGFGPSGVGAQMQMGAAIALTVGSLSLLNATVIGLMNGQKMETELCRRQYAAAFGMMVLGSTANAVGGVRDGGTETVANMRMVVSFQHVIASAAFCVGGVLMLPSMKPVDDGLPLQNSLIVISSLVGSIFLILSSIMNYFHTTALVWCQEEAFERDLLLGRQALRGYETRGIMPLTYTHYGDDDEDDVEVELLGEENTVERGRGKGRGRERGRTTSESGTSEESRKKARRELRRERQKKKRRETRWEHEGDAREDGREDDGEEEQEIERQIDERSFVRRLGDAVLRRGNQLLWNTDTMGEEEESRRSRRRRKQKRKRRRQETSEDSRSKDTPDDASLSMASRESRKPSRSNQSSRLHDETVVHIRTSNDCEVAGRTKETLVEQNRTEEDDEPV